MLPNSLVFANLDKANVHSLAHILIEKPHTKLLKNERLEASFRLLTERPARLTGEIFRIEKR